MVNLGKHTCSNTYEIDTGNDLPNYQDATKDALFSKGGGSKETEENARDGSNPALNHPGQAQ